MTGPTPLLDFFKRGEVARDARLLAAQGVLAPRAHEQLEILVHLLDDGDAEIRETAEQTLGRIPREALQVFLGRSDVSIGLREFFADRGIFPAEIPTIEVPEDEPLIEAAAAGEPITEEDADDTRQGVVEKLLEYHLDQLPMKGTREMRAILIRDPNKMIASSVLSSPKVSEPEIESFARMANVSEDVLRIIGSNRAWLKNYSIVAGLTRNPKTPLGLSLNLMSRLNDRDVMMLSVDRNVPEPLRIAARKRATRT